jgi:hypothetical protein
LLFVRDNALICAKNTATDVQFVWTGFDGDDCFNDFHVVVTTKGGTQQFNFGSCAVYALRKLSTCFRGVGEPSASLGFRNPDIRSCDVLRLNDGYRIKVQFEGNGFSREFVIQKPSLELHDEFLAEY